MKKISALRKHSNKLASKIRKGIATDTEIAEFERLDAIEESKRPVEPKLSRPRAWYDSPVAAAMWAADGASVER